MLHTSILYVYIYMTHLYIYIHEFSSKFPSLVNHQQTLKWSDSIGSENIFGVLEMLVIDMTSDDLMIDMISHG